MRFGVLIQLFWRLVADRRGATSTIMTLMIVPIVGALGMAVEGGGWFLVQRAAQNASDAAAMAAAINDCEPGQPCEVTGLSATFVEESAAVATKFGFVDDASTDIEAQKVVCPGSGSADTDCFGVRITKRFPVMLTRMVGFGGDATLDGQPAQTIRAVAIARPRGPGETYCITALGSGGSAIDLDGGGPGGSLDFGGCDFLAKGGATCTNSVGANSNIGYADVISTGASNKDCGTERPLAGAFPEDPYAGLAATTDALPHSCGSYPKANNQGNVGADQQIAGGYKSFSASSPYCGDIKLTGNVTLNADSQLVVHNGRLDLNGFKLDGNGHALTIILSSPTGATGYSHTITGGNGSVLDFHAPTSGDWHGIAIYRDPEAPNGSGAEFDWDGSFPAINITGVIYAPTADVEIAGNIQHATAGDACIAFYVHTVRVNGTIDIFANPTRECDRAGVTLPTVPGSGFRQALVQ